MHTLSWFDFERSVWGVTGGGEHEVDDRRDVSWRDNYSGSRYNNYENWLQWRNRNTSASDFRYERNGSSYAFIPLNPDQFDDSSRYIPVRQQYDSRELREHLYEARLDLGRDLGDGGFRAEVGGGARRVERTYDEDQFRHVPTSGANTFNLGASGAVIPGLCIQPPGALQGEWGQCIVAADYRAGSQAFAEHLAANPGQW